MMVNQDTRLNKTITSLETINTGAAHVGENIAALVESVFDGVFDSALAGLKKVIPWAVTLGPAIALYTSLVPPLAASQWLTPQTAQIAALALAIAFEGLGLFITRTLAIANDWNRDKLKSETEIPTGILKWFLAFYVIGGMALVLSIKGWDNPVSWFYASMFIIGPIAHTTGEYADKAKRLIRNKRETMRGREVKSGIAAEIKTARAELEALAAEVQQMSAERDGLVDEIAKLRKRKAKTETMADGVSPLTNTSIEIANDGKAAKIEARRNAVLEHKQQGLKNAEIARLLNVSPDTVRRDVKALNGAVQGVQL